jgi:ABC-2 type transport system ATP-binding protein
MYGIEVKGLIKNYGPLKAVNQINLRIKHNEIFGLLGPNGAGKSTLMECMTGIKKMDAGSVVIEGQDLIKAGQSIYDTIGVQLQETSYPDHIKVKELCEWFTSFYDQPRDYMPLLKQFHLESKLGSYVNKLSGGQKQKIAIILALIGNPKILFLDELTTGLDPASKKEMWSMIQSLKAEGMTIFLTTHNMEEATHLCDRIGIMDEGQLLVVDTLENVIRQTDLYQEVSFKAESSVMDSLKDVMSIEAEYDYKEGKVHILSQIEDLITHVILGLHHNGSHYQHIRMKHPTLEDAYLKLTGKKWEVSL